MSEKIEIETQFWKLPISVLSELTREQLRMIAKKYDIPRGRNKKDTINNLYKHWLSGKTDMLYRKVKITINI